MAAQQVAQRPVPPLSGLSGERRKWWGGAEADSFECRWAGRGRGEPVAGCLNECLNELMMLGANMDIIRPGTLSACRPNKWPANLSQGRR